MPILSVMESSHSAHTDGELRSGLAEADRLSTVAWTETVDVAAWVYPLCGLLFAATLFSVRAAWSNLWFGLLALALIAAQAFGIAWIARRRRAHANFLRMPAEFRRPVIGYFAGLFVITAVATAIAERSSELLGFVVCAAAAMTGMIVYRVHLHRAIESTRLRFGQP